MKTNLKSATEGTERNKLLNSLIILTVLAALNIFSASAFGIGCTPPCSPCEQCQAGICVNKCTSCQTCQPGGCVTTCSPTPCQTCVNGVCQPVCDNSLCLIRINGACQSWCDGITYTCENGDCTEKTWTYISYHYDEVGNRDTMTDSFGTTTYAYDYLSRLTSVTNPDNKTISYQYNANGNRTQLTDPADNVTTYTYDDDGRLETVNATASTTTYHYDSSGRQDRVDYPNGTYALYNYHSQRNFLLSVTNKNSSDAVLSSYTYTYDDVGNRQTVTELDDSTVTYTYDDIYQLTSETRTGANAYTITYQYDNVGNRLEMVKNAVTTTYTYNNNNQLTTETAGGVTITYSYDKNGNLLSKTGGGSTATYTWDWRNLLLSVTEPAGSTVYEYDGIGNRISKTQGGVKTKYINDRVFRLTQVLMETDNADVVQAIYNYGNDLISMNRASTNSYYNYDGLGSARQLTDSSEAVVASYTYDGFGNLIASSGTTGNPYGFTGEQQFSEADGLVFLRARYYKPSIGRFISRDPIGYRGGFNLYAYVKNRPTYFVDPSGNSCVYQCITFGFQGMLYGIVSGECVYICRRVCEDSSGEITSCTSFRYIKTIPLSAFGTFYCPFVAILVPDHRIIAGI